jgi:hypothetical protein
MRRVSWLAATAFRSPAQSAFPVGMFVEDRPASVLCVLKMCLCAGAGIRNRVPWSEVDQEARYEDATGNCARRRSCHPVSDDKRTSARAGGAVIAVPSHAGWQRPNHPVRVLDWRPACAVWNHCMHGYAERPADVAMFARSERHVVDSHGRVMPDIASRSTTQPRATPHVIVELVSSSSIVVSGGRELAVSPVGCSEHDAPRTGRSARLRRAPCRPDANERRRPRSGLISSAESGYFSAMRSWSAIRSLTLKLRRPAS